MLESKLERLLSTLAAPLLAAVPARKKKIVKPAKAQTKAKPKKSAKAIKPTKKVVPTKPIKHTPGKTKPAASPAREPAPVVSPKPKPVEPVVAPKPKPKPPLGRAILLSPENEKFSDTVTPTFRWLSVGGATRYEVAWSEEEGLTRANTLVATRTEAAVPVGNPLQLGVTYFWRVRGGNEGGWGLWSGVYSFRVLDEAT